MHPDQPNETTVKRKAEEEIARAVADGLAAGLRPDEVQSAIASGIDTYTSDEIWKPIIGEGR